jgi:hypothetical protein
LGAQRSAYLRGVRHWTLEEAAAALPEVRAIVARIRELVAAAQDHAAKTGGNGASVSGNGHGPASPRDDRELRGLLADLTGRGIVVRDPGRGLIDFPALAPDGNTYLLCWLDGEDAIEWWHWPDAGFAGRTPLSEPPI